MEQILVALVSWLLQILSGVVRDMVIIMLLPILASALFIWYKTRAYKRLIASVVKYGVWRGSGERTE